MLEAHGPMAVLVDALKSDDVQRRVKAIESLPQFCLALGPLRTREEMIPFIKDFMEDEEEVIMALVDCLPKITECLGGEQYSKLILESMEMLFMVENDTIISKVKNTITQIYAANKQVLKPEMAKLIDNFWKGDELAARNMSLFFFKMIADDLEEAEKANLIKILISKYKKEDRTMKTLVLETLIACPQSIKPTNFLKTLFDDVKNNIGNTSYMASVRLFLIAVLKQDDMEMTTKVFNILKEVDKSTARPFFKASVLLPVWNKLQNRPIEPTVTPSSVTATLNTPSVTTNLQAEQELNQENFSIDEGAEELPTLQTASPTLETPDQADLAGTSPAVGAKSVVVSTTTASGEMYDQDFVWKKLFELQVEKEKEDNLDVKDSRIRKEIEIFEILIENLCLEKIGDGFFEALEVIIFKDEFLVNTYLKHYWSLEALALQSGEKNKKLKEAMISLDLKRIKSKTENIDKISEGIKNILTGFDGSALIASVEEFLETLIDLALGVENWRDRLDAIDILIKLSTSYPKYMSIFKLNYSKLIFDNAYETRQHACKRYIEFLSLETKGPVDKEFVALIESALNHKSSFKRLVALQLVQVD